MSADKYSSWTRYLLALAKRLPIRILIRPLVNWLPLSDPNNGYTIVIACHRRFPEMLQASLKLLYRDELPNLRETIIVIDGHSTDRLKIAEDQFLASFPKLNIRFIYQTWFQSKICRFISWGWVDCWLSYCTGLANSTTKVVMLHDMDAMIVKKGLIEGRYEQFMASNTDFMGYLWYNANGITPEMEICVIVEMFLNVQHLRAQFKPLDLFNRIGIHRGVKVDFDTLLYPQALSTKKIVRRIDEKEMVHPSQVISQFAYLADRRGYAPPEGNNMFFIPYFLFIADGNHNKLKDIANSMSASASTKVIPFYGHRMNITHFSKEHFRWICKQIFRIEYSYAHEVRSDVSEYLKAIGQAANLSNIQGLLDEVSSELAPEKEWLCNQFGNATASQ
jgi:glycosyltransferase involved in cell wall biosynthesis